MRAASRTLTRSWPRARPSTLAAAALLLTAGCGGGDDGHDRFVERVNAVCERHFAEVEAVPPPQDTTQLLRYMQELTRLQRVELDDLREVRAPERDARDYRRMLTQMEHVLALYPDLRAAVQSNQTVAIESVLERADSFNARAGAAALRLGLEACVPAEAEE